MRHLYRAPVNRSGLLARNVDGLFFNNPTTLGAELFVNPGFAADTNWTKGSGWTITGGVGVGTTTSGTLQQGVGTIGKWFQHQFDLVSRTAGSVIATQASGVPLSVAATYTHKTLVGSVTSGLTGSSFSGTVDNCSLKKFTDSEVLVLYDCFRPFVPVSLILPNSPLAYQVQIIVLCDSYTNALNYIYAGYGITNNASQVKMNKIVNGVSTSLIGATTITPVANAALEVIRPLHTNTFQLWYNNVQVGTTQTVTDAGIIGNTLFGFAALDPTSLITDLKFNGISVL